ncbi:mannose-6-phosphate isomerase, class I [Thaumasiovibrio sp. DFM-14]|uniref:mannose-6-phosphate isomerase, class I n=1 Tax=Thaumasiovibrio sp. DFM-14 TaxID=3384792 RepID=UPI0039A0B9B4
MQSNLFKLDNVIQNYVWGSLHAMNELFGIANPNNQPQAEIWMGAHPNGCSTLADNGMLLSELIKQDPNAVLGEYTAHRFGDLPYLFKVLSADKVLSVQVHPRKDKAQQGFSTENELGIELGAPNRNYKDDNHKPELVYALTFYKAMNGFRPISEIISLFEQVNIKTLADELTALKALPTSVGLRAFFAAVMSLSGEKKRLALAELKLSLSARPQTAKAREAFELISGFADEYADDIGLFSPLLLNVIELEPGEAMFLHAETPHAYVQGTGLEIMANSDNVLRAGLTPKHMDVEELIDNTVFESINYEDLRLAPTKMEGKRSYAIPVDDFGFEVLESLDNIRRSQFVRSAEILFCIEGEVSLVVADKVVTLKAGESAFVCHSATSYQYQGSGTLARAFN